MNPYRNWLAEARRQLSERLARLKQHSLPLEGKRRRLPKELRATLERHESRLGQPIRGVEDAKVAAETLGRYEEQLDLALEYSALQVLDRAATRRRRLRFSSWVLACVALTLLIMLFGARGAQRDLMHQCSQECEREGRCYPSLRDVLARSHEPRCVMLDETDCEASCRLNGACEALAGRCEATQHAQCASSVACAQEGRCWALGGECLAQSAVDCETSAACTRAGRCTLSGFECVAESPEDCAASSGCLYDGRCGFVRGECKATEWRHCTESLGCKQNHRCRYDAATHTCWQASQDNPCGLSVACRHRGLCNTNHRTGCFARSRSDCVSSYACQMLGHCSVHERDCRAANDADCQQSTACHEEGRCRAEDGQCVL